MLGYAEKNSINQKKIKDLIVSGGVTTLEQIGSIACENAGVAQYAIDELVQIRMTASVCQIGRIGQHYRLTDNGISLYAGEALKRLSSTEQSMTALVNALVDLGAETNFLELAWNVVSTLSYLRSPESLLAIPKVGKQLDGVTSMVLHSYNSMISIMEEGVSLTSHQHAEAKSAILEMTKTLIDSDKLKLTFSIHTRQNNDTIGAPFKDLQDSFRRAVVVDLLELIKAHRAIMAVEGYSTYLLNRNI